MRHRLDLRSRTRYFLVDGKKMGTAWITEERRGSLERDRVKWNSRYLEEGFFIGPDPSPYLVERMELVESLLPGKKALDIACGEGRNSIFLARRGLSVTGVDISEEGLAKAAKRAADEHLQITFLRADLETSGIHGSWDLILNFNFLLRPLIPQSVAALTPGGVIVFETILDTPFLPGSHTPDFLLQPGELPLLFESFAGTIRHYEESPAASSPTARLIFQKQHEQL